MKEVWIEFPEPKDAADAETTCKLANSMFARLGCHPVNPLTWNDTRKRYEWGSPMGYETLQDWGKWFNLDFLGRSG